MSFLRGFIVWIGFFVVIPWLDHGIQLKILKLLVFFIVFMDPVVKPRGDTVGFTSHATMPSRNDEKPIHTYPILFLNSSNLFSNIRSKLLAILSIASFAISQSNLGKLLST